MNAIDSVVYDSSAGRALTPARCPIGPWPETACLRLDKFPFEPEILAGLILSQGERQHWKAMRAVEKRRREWLLGRCVAKEAVRALMANPDLSPQEIEILPDPYGRPLVRTRVPLQASVSIAHSEGTAVALASLDPAALLGIDIESLAHRCQDFESIAFSPDERALLASLQPEAHQVWALRLWSAKEAVGKALGRGLSAGLLAFHITRADFASGIVEVELRDAALGQFPELRGKSLIVYTLSESNFVFSAIIYQQGVVRMRSSRQEILDYLLQKMGELTQDWDYPDPVRPESLLFTELGFESLDAVVLCTAIQEHYKTPMPFAELRAEIGQQQRDLSIDELTDFVNTHLGNQSGTSGVTGRIQ